MLVFCLLELLFQSIFKIQVPWIFNSLSQLLFPRKFLTVTAQFCRTQGLSKYVGHYGRESWHVFDKITPYEPSVHRDLLKCQ